MRSTGIRTPHARPLIARLTAVALAAIAGATCSDATGPKLPALSALTVLRDSIAFTPQDSLLVPFAATDANGVTAYADAAAWKSRDGGIVKVISPGWIRGIAAGRTWIVAENGSLRDSLLAIVNPSFTVHLTPALDTMRSIGDTLRLAVSLNGPGAPPPLAWGTRDTSVARVDQQGAVAARNPGATWVVALEPGGGRDSARIVVRQRVVRVDLAPSVRIPTLPVTWTDNLVASAFDARGVAVTGRAVHWSTSDPSRIAVDSAGLITGVAAGTDTLRAAVDGVVGEYAMTAYVPALTADPDTVLIGPNQTHVLWFRVQPTTDRLGAARVALTNADTNVATTGTAETAGYDWVDVVGRAPGRTTITATADRFTTGHATVIVSRGRFLADSQNIQKGRWSNALGVAFGDSTGEGHTLGAPLVIHMLSRDTSIARPSDSTIANAGDWHVDVATAARGVGTTWVVVSAEGYATDSIKVDVTQFHQSAYFGLKHLYTAPGWLGWTGVGVTDPYTRWIRIASLHPDIATVPDSIDMNSYYPYLNVHGVSIGVDSVVAWSDSSGADTLVVTVAPLVYHVIAPDTLSGGAQATATFQALDSIGRRPFSDGLHHALLTVDDPRVIILDHDTVTWAASTEDPSVRMTGGIAGTAHVTITDLESGAQPLTFAVQVRPGQATLAYGSIAQKPPLWMGMRQTLPDSAILRVFATDGVRFTLRSTDPSLVTPSVDTITGSYYSSPFNITTGDHEGTAWLILESPVTAPESLAVHVGKPLMQLDLVSAYHPGDPPLTHVHVLAPDGNERVAAEAVTFTLWSSNTAVTFADPDTVTVQKGGSVSSGASVHFGMPGSAAIRAIDPRQQPYAYKEAATRIFEVDRYGHATSSLIPVSAAPLPQTP